MSEDQDGFAMFTNLQCQRREIRVARCNRYAVRVSTKELFQSVDGQDKIYGVLAWQHRDNFHRQYPMIAEYHLSWSNLSPIRPHLDRCPFEHQDLQNLWNCRHSHIVCIYKKSCRFEHFFHRVSPHSEDWQFDLRRTI